MYLIVFFIFNPNKIFIGYSQGGLIARGILEVCGNVHNVKTFVSLSSPQGGQYGGMCFYFNYCTDKDKIIYLNSHQFWKCV